MSGTELWNDEQIVNTTTFEDQNESKVVALEGGGYVVVWNGKPDSGSPVGTYAQVYDAFGYKVGSEIAITTGLDASLPDVAALAGGGFVVGWIGIDAYGSWGTVGRTFDASGQATGEAFTLNGETDPDSPANQFGLALTALDGGGFAAAYISIEGGTYVLKVQRLDSSGTKTGPEIVVGVDAELTVGGVAISSIGAGRFAVAWSASDGTDQNVYARIYEDDGDPATASFPVVEGAGNQLTPAIAGDGSGSFLVAFFDSQSGQVMRQFYNAALQPVGTSEAISDGTDNGSFGQWPAVIGLRGGGYFVVWTDWLGAETLVVGQILDAAGNRVGDEIVIKASPDPANNVQLPNLSLLADGRIAVTWEGIYPDGPDTDLSSVHTVIVDVRNGDITGTGKSETLLGSKGAVNDTITALNGDDVLHGFDGDDELDGGEGADQLWGGAGADSMSGGTGDDFYYVDDEGDVVAESVGEGNDTVEVEGANFTLASGSEIETLQLEGGGDYDITGNEFGQLLMGDWSNNKLMGLGGNDTLDGGGNIDFMEGGTGDDLYLVNHEAEHVVEFENGGNDTVQTDGSNFSLEAWDHVENLILGGSGGAKGKGNSLANHLTGNSNDNVIHGRAGNDTLVGLGGSDTLHGEAGNDTYEIDSIDVVVEGEDNGIDTVVAAFDYKLGANVENLVLTGVAVKGTGNDLANALTGNSGANLLKGGGGNDTLDGGSGKDSLEGGGGSDTYVLGNSKDIVIDTGGSNDTITSTTSRKLVAYAGIENLTLLGTRDAKGQGTSAANDLIGNTGKNQLKGKGGEDLLRGLEGADQLWGGSGGDVFDFNSSAEIGKGSGKRDIIRDFEHLVDRIDLKSIDAKTNVSGNNGFKFMAAEGSSFTGVAGQLIWDQKNKAGTSNDITLVSGDTNGDGIADFTLELTGLVTLTKADFIL
jgi:Ca2+-binding RTX toxin-like protein